ncbi:MAG: DUF2461 domain-containing protein [Pirellulaceae bacterium]
MNTFDGFPRDTIEFLHELSENNTRDWFAANKQRYEQSVLDPALGFISSLANPLARAAPMLDVKAKKVGGSLMRIYKDTRFSKDKTPYKTNIGIQFRHTAGKDVHAPGLYVHIEPSECFFGAGMWRPDATALAKIRQAIAEEPASWKKAVGSKCFRETFSMYDDRLKTAPRGIAKDHPQIDDLRLKSFIAMKSLPRKQIEDASLTQEIVRLARAAAPLMGFLCQAVEQPY